MTFSDSVLMDYIVCPARAFINLYSEKKSPRQVAKDRYPLMLYEIAIHMLNGNRISDPGVLVDSVVSKAFSDLDYWKREIDLLAIKAMFVNFINMIPRDEFVIDGLARKFTNTYGDIPISSQIDLTISDRKGKICPTVIDYSNTKYDVFYNPILYKCQLVCDHIKSLGSNTTVMVLTICAGKQWPYNQSRYDTLMVASISEYLTMMEQDMFPARVGWWCVSCPYRGICHRLIEPVS